MIQLHGFALSNYYNKVKFVLLEYGIAFEEVRISLPIRDDASLAASPLGKVPFIRTEHGELCESQVIVEYLADRFPEKGIFPADPFMAAKQRELIAFVELHIELAARELYGQAFFGGTASEETKARVERLLAKRVPAFERLARFSPYLAGETFGIADIAAFVSLPLAGIATKLVLGRDLLLEMGLDWNAYVKRIEAERPAARRVAEDCKVCQAEMSALLAGGRPDS